MPPTKKVTGSTPAKTAQPPRHRRRLVSDYIGGPDIVGLVRDILAKKGARARIADELAASVTARLTLAVQDINETNANDYDFHAYTSAGDRHYIGASEKCEGDAQSVPTADTGSVTPVAALPETDEIVTTLRDVYRTQGEEPALDYLYETYHTLILDARDLGRADRILGQLPVEEFPTAILIGVLMTTHPHKKALSARPIVFARTKERLKQLPDGAENAPYLAGLE